ncbi:MULTISPECIES: family 20 glycosylhydrolase [unclassified Lactococcus]|uniref:family 20 glycosylhydrolase n=1 Tax=unclassified Lactococcus TaxID=2643510 RepID=UPI00164FE487|nr:MULTISPECIES: family 20 glycosylhydrolase [unclassified Lactococcus]
MPNIKWFKHVLFGAIITVLIFVTASHVYADTTENSSTTITASPSLTQGGTLNFDLARHPLTLDEMKLLIDALQTSEFSNLSLRLGDSERLMYQSTYLQNTNSDAFSIVDLRELVLYAAQRQISIIPDLDLPSHAGAILNALKLSHPDFYQQLYMDDNTLDYTNPLSIELAKTLAAELYPIFEGQQTQAFVIGADEVPGSDSLYENYLTTFINQVSTDSIAHGYTPIIWNDSILKSEVPKLNTSILIYYWSQAGHTQGEELLNRGATRASVSDFLNAGFQVLNANDYSNTYHLSNIGDINSENYFLNYLKNISNSSLFQEVIDGESQWWTTENTQNTGSLISFWGENSSAISISAITSLIERIVLP